MKLFERYNDIVNELSQYKDDDSIFIRMATIPKLGINPLPSQFNTPTGIYAYPLKEMFSSLQDNSIPWGRKYPYVLIIKQIQPILDVSQYTTSMLKRDIEKIRILYLKKMYENYIDNEKANNMFNTSIKKWINESLLNNPCSYLFNITRHISNILAQEKTPKHGWSDLISQSKYSSEQYYNNQDFNFYSDVDTFKKRANAASWNALFRALGYNGFTDKTGIGVIHSNEPIQAVFFSIKPIKLINIFKNVRK